MDSFGPWLGTILAVITILLVTAIFIGIEILRQMRR